MVVYFTAGYHQSNVRFAHKLPQFLTHCRRITVVNLVQAVAEEQNSSLLYQLIEVRAYMMYARKCAFVNKIIPKRQVLLRFLDKGVIILHLHIHGNFICTPY